MTGRLVLSLFLLGGLTTLARAAQDVDALQRENSDLRQRLDKLEKEVGELQSLLPALKDKPVHSSLDFKLYGYIKLDAARDDSRANLGNFARWVESEAPGEHDDQFSMTANQTRLGADITGPEAGSWKTTGKVEIDFYGSGTAENKPEPLLRHAYLNAYWPDCDFSLLAGQTSDIISPLVMPTVNYTVGWWQGNIGYIAARRSGSPKDSSSTKTGAPNSKSARPAPSRVANLDSRHPPTRTAEMIPASPPHRAGSA